MEMVKIISAKYLSDLGKNIAITANIDGEEVGIPLDPANRHYAAIMELVNAGELTIAEADA